jgi:peptide/nickel transport system permease protein
MTGFVLRRILEAVPLLLGVIVVNFAIINLAPGDPVQAMIGDFPAPPEYVEALRERLGLHLPLWQQLLNYMGGVLKGDLGYSFGNRQPVLDIILQRAGNTMILTVTALLFASVAGIIIGVNTAKHPGTWRDTIISSVSLAGFSIPAFWLGQLLILLFAVQLRWLPAQGMASVRAQSEGLAYMLDLGTHLLLPMLALSMRYVVSITRLTRASVVEAMGSDYIVTALAKGASVNRVLYRHALPNALLPVATSIGYNFGYVLAGSALVETVFAWPGMGRLLFDAMSARDTPIILGVFLISATMAVLANLATDLVYGFIDPRMRRRRR